MKGFKKILALVLVAMMAMGMVSALAVTGAFDGTTAPAPALAVDENGYDTVTFKINFKPEAGLTTPAYTFEYEIAPQEGQAAGVGPEVKTGINGAQVTGSVAFAAKETSKTATITFPTFSSTEGAGIYRYKITQKAISSDGIKAGILNDKGNGNIEVRFVDVYVNKDGKIISAVMFKDTTAANGSVADGDPLAEVNSESKVPYATKVDSFENTFGKKGNTDPDPDDPTYPDPNGEDPDPTDSGKHTVTVTKAVAGNMASTTQQFPFIFEVTSKGLSLEGATYEIDKNGTKTNVTFNSTTSQGQFTLANGESVTITVPNNVSVKVQETIKEGEGYTVTNANDNTSDTWGTGWQAEGTTNLKDVAGITGDLVAAADGDKALTYTNTRNNISPTGLVLRYAPYFAMFAAGVALFIILGIKRRKNEEE